MKRRTFIVGVAVAGVAGYKATNAEYSIPELSLESQQDLSEQELSGGFERIEFQEDGTAEIYFDQFHDMDGFVFKYHKQSIERSLYSCSAPHSEDDFSVTLPIIELIQNSEIEYPDRKFNLVSAKGGFAMCGQERIGGIITETMDTATFKIPSQFEI